MPNLGSSVGRTVISGPDLGQGTDQIGLLVAEDSFNGNVQFTINVNGLQVGGVQTATTIQAGNSEELFTLNGNWAPGSTVSVDFLNDDWDGSTGNGHDRNLYVDGVIYNGTPVSNAITVTNWNGVSYYSTQATVRTHDFVEGVGVGTHLLYYDTSYANEAVVLTELKYLGFDQVRDGGANADPVSLAPFEMAMAAGVKFNFTTAISADIATAINNLETLLAKYPGSIVSTEGVNEIPASFSYGGLTGEDAGNLYQQQLYAAVHADPKLAAVSVLNYTLPIVYDQAAYQRYGNISSESDLANVHLYDYAGLGGLSNYISTLLPRMLTGTPNAKGFVVTEAGYNTLSDSEDVSAKYLLDAVFDLKQAGASMTYLYELMDENPDPGLTNTENHFGLFNSDGTPKEAAIAFHNLTTILADTGVDAATFTPGYLGYSISGLPADGNSMLLAKSNGTFDLAVWAEPTIRGGSIAPVSAVTIDLQSMAALVQVFDPLLGSVPISTEANVSTLTVQVTDHPLIIQIIPKTLQINLNTDTPPLLSTTVFPVTEPTTTQIVLTGGGDASPMASPSYTPDTVLSAVDVPMLASASNTGPAGANLVVKATEPAGNSSLFQPVVVTTNTLAPIVGAPDLSAASDNGGAGNRITNVSTSTVVGTAPGVTTVTVNTAPPMMMAAPVIVMPIAGAPIVTMPADKADPAHVQVSATTTQPSPTTVLRTHDDAGMTFRFFDSTHGTQFVTSSLSERDSLIATRPDLAYEGPGMGTVQSNPNDANVASVFRFFSKVDGTHFFTISATEKDQTIATRSDLTFEGSSFNEHLTAQAGDVAVYRFFNGSNGSHFFTTSDTERVSISATRSDMIDEGVAFYAPKI